MLNEALSKMEQTFSSALLLQGHEYYQRGQVLNVRLSEGLLKGRVKGVSSHLYDVHMDLKVWPKVSSFCNCSVQHNCKHAAACLFALQAREHPSDYTKLDRKLDVWLKNLSIREKISTPITVTHHLHYLITLQLKNFEHQVCIELALAKLLKKGGYGKKSVFNSLSNSKKEHFLEADNEIIPQLLYKCNTEGWFDRFKIRNSELLEKILATGRAFLTLNPELPILLGEKKSAACEWVLEANGNQKIILMDKGQIITPLLLDTCWYFDIEERTMGYLSTPYPLEQLSYLLNAPPIPLNQAQLLADKMFKTCPEFPLPRIFEQRELIIIKPEPVLILDAFSDLDLNTLFLYEKDESLDALFLAKVVFNYAGSYVDQEDPCETVVKQEEQVLLEYPRDLAFEKEKMEELGKLVVLSLPQPWMALPPELKNKNFRVMHSIDTLSDLEIFYNETIAYLKNQGWKIIIHSPFYQQILTVDEIEWYSELQDKGNDFFSYQLGILVEGEPVNIVPLVVNLIQQYNSADLEQLPDAQLINLPLNNSKILQVQMGRIKPLLRLLLQLGMSRLADKEQMQINKYHLILMREAELSLAATKARWQGAESFRQHLRILIEAQELPQIPSPKYLNASLREYQQYGLNWLQFLRSSGFNGILADDMGLGKTVQTLAHLQYEKEQGRLKHAALIIAPTSLVGNWLAEAKRFTPQLNILVYHGSERHQDLFDDYDVVISTYGLIHRDKDKFIDYCFYYLILDEAQFIKNARTKTTQIIQQLQASHRLCLTGTPLENNLGELWSLFHFLIPGLLGDAKQFRLWFRIPIEKHGDKEKRELLVKRIKPFMLRRTKNQVASELPPKTEMLHSVEITGPQRDLYEIIRISMEKKVRDAIAKQGLGKSHILLLDALLKLRQICCDPRLLSLPQAAIAHGNSSKLEMLMELLDNLVHEGRRILVFSQFTSMLKLIEEELVQKKYDYLKLTGQTRNRQALVDEFQQGTVPIFLISLKAGGTGLNLTGADTVIHYDPWWNPAVEDQATDRTHRIGQLQPVFVYKLITSGTVEETILEMQNRKRQLVDGILSADADSSISLTEEDLERFFMPLN